MTIEEFKLAIAKAQDLSWYNSINEKIHFVYINQHEAFTSVSALYEFATKQNEGWDKLQVTDPDYFNDSRLNFQNLKANLEHFIINFVAEPTDRLQGNWDGLVKPIVNALRLCFTSDAPETIFLFNLYNKSQRHFGGAFEFIKGNTNNITNKDQFIGAMLAYEFSQKGDTEIAKRVNIESESISNLKSNFSKYLSDSEKILTEHLAATNAKYNDFSSKTLAFKDEQELSINNWFDSSRTQFEAFSNKSNNRIVELETTYQEKLRLAMPAEYWNKRALKLKSEGWQALKWLIGLIVFACVTLYCLLWLTPGGMLLSFIDDKAGAIKWSIIYITFISFLAIGIRALSKVMFSAFHLARDAEEREQLTYVYLALIKDSSVDKDDKHLIMQSLFSRADTGLLKEDSSPTMPGGFVEKIIKN